MILKYEFECLGKIFFMTTPGVGFLIGRKNFYYSVSEKLLLIHKKTISFISENRFKCYRIKQLLKIKSIFLYSYLLNFNSIHHIYKLILDSTFLHTQFVI